MKKLSASMKAELTDEEVEQVAGGHSKEHWLQMTTEERTAAYFESQDARAADPNAYCAFFDPNA